jgi:hypothetical protein
MFGVLQMISFTQANPQVVHDLLSRSRSKHTGFPLMAMSLNLSLVVLHVLRSGGLNRICNKNKRKDGKEDIVMEAADNLFVALWLVLQRQWVKEKLTVEGFGTMLIDLRKRAVEKAEQMLKDGELALGETLAMKSAKCVDSPDNLESFSSF